MIELKDHPRGVVLSVRAKPGARKNELLDEHAGAVRISVTAPPEKGKANEAIIALLAESLNVRRAQITLLAGASARDKSFLFEGISALELRTRIESVLEPTMFDPPREGPRAPS